MLLKSGLIFILLIISNQLFGQTIDTAKHADTSIAKPAPVKIIHTGYYITGKVMDANTGEGLPFATIYFPHTPVGTATDIDGNFIFHLESLPHDTLQAKAIGYKVVTKILQKSKREYNFNIEMERASASLKEHTVTAKGVDPALLLLKRIIQHKPVYNPDRAENYQYEAYNRVEIDLQRMSYDKFMKIPFLKNYGFIFQNLDTVTDAKPYLPLYLTESISDFYFRKSPQKQREVIKGSMAKGINNDEVVKFIGTSYLKINIYDNHVPIFDKKFVSPISDQGAFYYKYSIKDTQVINGRQVLLVHFKPRRDGDLCFTGDFWVYDTIFAVERISMDVPKSANINWVEKVSVYQEFSPIDSFWFCTKDKFVATVTLYGSQKIPGFIGRKTITYHNIKVNDTAIDVALDNPEWKEEVIKTDSVKDKTIDWWTKNRPDSLTKTEIGIYKMVDTVNSMPLTTMYKNWITFLAGGVKDVGPIELGPYWYVYTTNPREGHRFRLSIGTPRSLENVKLTGYLAYGTHDERFKYGFTGKWFISKKQWTYIYSEMSRDISQGMDNFDHIRTDNIFSGLIRKPGIEWKQSFMEKQRVEFFRQYYSGFSNTFSIQHRRFIPFEPLPSKEIFKDMKGHPTDHVNSTEVGLNLRYAYKEKFFKGKYKMKILRSKYPVVELGLTYGFKDVLRSAYEYKKVNLSLKENILIPPFGHIVYNVFCGKYFGTLPYPLLEVHPGNEFYYYDKYSFQMMNNFEFISDEYAGFTIDHNIGGGIFNHIPLLKKLKFRQFWTAKGLIGTLNKENRELNINPAVPYRFRTLGRIPYLELGTGVSNILQVFRIDLVWRVMPKLEAKEPITKYFGMFISANFEF